MLKEHHVVLKNPRQVDLRFASCYPNLYRTAMSSLGFHIIYHFLNSREDVWCERVVYPYYRSLESSTPLKNFDIIGFSLQYEQDYFHLLEMLEKGGVPYRKKDRDHNHPLVIAGGPCATANPLPLSPFVDLFIVGEAEVIMDELIDTYLELDDPKGEIDAFKDIKGVYVPDNPVKKALVKDMDQACHPIYQVVPETDDKNLIPALGSSFLLGVSRGCTRGCRFCMAGYLYRPRREASLNKLFKIAEKGYDATGLQKIALIGAAVSDYSRIDELCSGLLERGFKVGTPSLRIESITSGTLESLQQSGLKTITLAPESVWKVRKSLNKPVSDEKTIKVLKKALHMGMNIKMYFLSGSPFETYEDTKDMVTMMKDLLKLSPRKNAIRFSVNPLIPKPHTPLQWEGYDVKEIKSRLNYIKSQLKGYPLKVDSPRSGLIQYVLSTGGLEVADLIEKSYKNQLSFRDWLAYSARKDFDLELPWKNIDVGLRADFLKEEYDKMKEGEITPWCEEAPCYNCSSSKSLCK